MNKQFSIRARITFSSTVTVEAKTVEEAKEKFEKRDWIDEQRDETLDWEAEGEPREE